VWCTSPVSWLTVWADVWLRAIRKGDQRQPVSPGSGRTLPCLDQSQVIKIIIIGCLSLCHCLSTLCLKKVPTFKLSVTVSNLIFDYQNFCTARKRMKFSTKPIWHYPLHSRHVATISWEIKNSNFLQIFSRYDCISITCNLCFSSRGIK